MLWRSQPALLAFACGGKAWPYDKLEYWTGLEHGAAAAEKGEKGKAAAGKPTAAANVREPTPPTTIS